MEFIIVEAVELAQINLYTKTHGYAGNLLSASYFSLIEHPDSQFHQYIDVKPALIAHLHTHTHASPKSKRREKDTIQAKKAETARKNRKQKKQKSNHLVNINIPPTQFNLGLLDFFLQFVVRLGDVVEGQDRHTEPAEQVASEGY